MNTSARISVDLDGTLARHDGWKGVEDIGQTLPVACVKDFSMAALFG